jgi:hypothetical protein
MWTQRYKQTYCEYTEAKAPGFFKMSGGYGMKVTYPKVTSANGLRKAIINFMIWNGHHLEATNTMGRPIDKRETYTDIIGRTRVIGSLEWQKGSGTVGSSDAKGHLNIKGRDYAIPLYVEIKWNKDTQSDPQKDYEQIINNTGGIYVIAKTIEGYFFWYDNFLLSLNALK